MLMHQIGGLIEILLLGWFFAVACTVLLQIASGRILLRGLLSPGHGDDQGVHLHRLQMLVVSVGFAAAYLVQALHAGPGQPMPDIPQAVLFTLAGSQGLYLGGKVASR